jgi:fatty-acyl-CoA synthase
MTSWNYADLWEGIAQVQPEAPAVIQGPHTLTWGEFDQRSKGVARWLLSLGATSQDKVALYLYNSPEYLEGVFASLRTGLVPVNTNYRYGTEELTYLWDNADAIAVVFHGTFVEKIEEIRAELPNVRGWLWVADGTGPCPKWATPYAEVAVQEVDTLDFPWERTPDDLVMLYTGGTTGMPKGVMWRQDDLFARLNGGGFRHFDEGSGTAGAIEAIEREGPGLALLPACPLMHGTGLFTAIETLSEAGRVVLLEHRAYDPHELAATIDRAEVNVAVIVGDPFARPLLDALTEEGATYSLKSLVAMMSSGAMWSQEIKQALLAFHPGMMLIDAFSSSEALGMGSSVSQSGSSRHTGEFTLGPEVRVLDDEGNDVVPGSDVTGVLALGGRNPVGYYKDPAKSAATFREIDGKRYSVPGDFAKVHADGTIQLLGRGSQCINTGGEKVFPEEVEEVLKRHDAVVDACVVGIPDSKTGERVVAMVELTPGTADPGSAALIEHVKVHLAHYKAPKGVRVIESIGRSPSGKMDYARHKAEAVAWFSAESSRAAS